MSSEIAQLRERLLLEGQAIYLGLHGYGEVAKHEIIRQRNRQVSQTIKQLDSHIGEEATDVILCEALELATQAYQKEQQPKAHTNLHPAVAISDEPCHSGGLAPPSVQGGEHH